jgi:hypothetical protein
MAKPTEIDYNATYQVDESTGSLVRSSSKHGSYGFKGFYKPRTELTGTPDFNVNWLPHNRPGLLEGQGFNKRKYRPGRGHQPEETQGRSDWDIDHEPADISGMSNLRPTPAPTMPTAQGAIGPRSGYNLHNVSTVRQAEPWSIGMAHPAIGAQGALPRGSQFDAVGGLPSRPALGPAGSSSITTKTETTGKRRGQMSWDI